MSDEPSWAGRCWRPVSASNLPAIRNEGLSRQIVHLWKIPLNPPSPWIQKLWQVLDPEERQRADRYRTSKLRDTFITTRGMVRVLLASHLKCHPTALRFTFGAFGKPFLFSPAQEPRASFNLTHSAHLALLAVTLGREVGVDVEDLGRTLNPGKLAQRVCSPQELEIILRLPDKDRLTAFLNCWTRKEAYVKALGRGMTFPLRDVTVTVAPGLPPRLEHVAGREQEAQHWKMLECPVGPLYTAALIAEGHDWEWIGWEWEWNGRGI